MLPRHLATYMSIAALCPLLLCGCGRGNRLETTTVTGTVTLDGKPLTSGMVIFTPERGRAATATIQSDGTYMLGTYGSHDGATLGKHHVAVVAREGGDEMRGPVRQSFGKWLIPPLYSDFTKSGLAFEVKADGPNLYDIKLSSTAKPAHP
jgi:hypothetical protein